VALAALLTASPAAAAEPPPIPEAERHLLAQLERMAARPGRAHAEDRQLARHLLASMLGRSRAVGQEVHAPAVTRATGDAFALQRRGDLHYAAYIAEAEATARRLPVSPPPVDIALIPTPRAFAGWLAQERRYLRSGAGNHFNHHLARAPSQVTGRLRLDGAETAALHARFAEFGRGQVPLDCRQLRQGPARTACVADTRAKVWAGVGHSYRAALDLDESDAWLARARDEARDDALRAAIDEDLALNRALRAEVAAAEARGMGALLRELLVLGGLRPRALERARTLVGDTLDRDLARAIEEERRWPNWRSSPGYLLWGDTPMWAIQSASAFRTGRQEARLRSDELRVFRDRIDPGSMELPSAIAVGGRAPAGDLELRVERLSEPPPEVVLAHMTDNRRWDRLAPEEHHPEVRLLFGVSHIDTVDLRTPEGIVPAAPMTAYAVALRGPTLRILRMTQGPNPRRKRGRNFVDEVLHEVEDPALAAPRLPVRLTVAGAELTVEAGGVARRFTLPEAREGFIGLAVFGTGYVGVAHRGLSTPAP